MAFYVVPKSELTKYQSFASKVQAENAAQAADFPLNAVLSIVETESEVAQRIVKEVRAPS